MNVNDLNKSSQRVNITQPGVSHQGSVSANSQNISISTVQNNTPISINATGEVSGVAENNDTGNRPVIRINPNRKKSHRSVGAKEELETINPNDYIEPAPKPDPKFFQDKYISELDAAVRRKQQEYKDAVEQMIEEDAVNRENVENGLETVGDELQYMPDPLHHPMTEDEKVKVDAPINSDRGIVTEDLDDEDYVDDESAEPYEEEEVEVPTNTVINNGFGESSDDNIVTEDIEDEEATDEVVEDHYDPEAKAKEEEVVHEDPVDIMDNNILHVTSDDIEDIDDDDISDLDEDEEDSPESDDDSVDAEEYTKLREAGAENLRSDVLKKIVNAGRKINAAQLVVSNKVINIKDAIKNMKVSTKKTAVVPLMYANRPYMASSLKGAEIALLADAEENSNEIITPAQARILFEHDVNPYRPDTVEAWAKTIPYADLDSIYLALFIASLDGANYLPYQCANNHCMNSWLSDDIPVDTTIKFTNDKTEARYNNIKAMELTAENSGTYESVITLVNNSIAVGIKIPSLYTIMYEYGSLDDNFTKKYSTIINIIRFIDRIYVVDEDANLHPVAWKKYPGDHTKTFKSKIATYAKILKELDTVDFNIIMSLVYKVALRDDAGVEYSIPASKCPKCGHPVEARSATPRELLFIRQQLVRIATTSTER